jgi:lactocepin
MANQKRNRLLALALALCLALGMLLPAGQVNAEGRSAGILTEVTGQEREQLASLADDTLALEEPTEASPAADTPVRVFIVLSGKSALEQGYAASAMAEATAYTGRLLNRQAAVIESIETQVLKEPLEVRYQFTAVANAISAVVPYGSMEEIATLPGVEQVCPVPVYETCQTELSPMTITTGDMVGSYGTWENGYTGAGMRIAVIDTGLDLDHPSFDPAAYDYALGQEQGSWDLLDQEEIAQVLPRLTIAQDGLTAADLYRNTKVAFGYNYVDGDLDITHDHDSAGDHGTHVSGIATANRYVPKDGGFASAAETVLACGVAPEAQLLVMKVFGKNGGAYADDYMAAIQDAISLGCDAINLSLGSNSPGFVDPAGSGVAYAERLFQSLTQTDTVVTISAGNAYSAGFQSATGTDLHRTSDPDVDTVGSPGSYENALTVASVTNSGLTGPYLSMGQINASYTAVGSAPSGLESWESLDADGEGTEYPFVFLGDPTSDTDTRKYAMSQSDFNGLDVTGKIVLVSRGTNAFSEKHSFAAQAGARAVIVYNNTSGTVNMDLSASTGTIPCVFLTQKDMQRILAASEQGADGSWGGVMTLHSAPAVLENAEDGYRMSDFSSWGVPGDLSLKPEITAPGGNIYSTLDGGAYGAMSGTSMAAPAMAGLSALVLQYIDDQNLTERTGLSARALAQALLMSTAKPLTEESGLPYSPRKQGAGLANAQKATTAQSYLLTGAASGNDGKVKVELGDDPDRTGSYQFTFTVYNLSQEPKTYAFGSDVLTEAVETLDGVDYMAETSHGLSPKVDFAVASMPYDLTGDNRVDREDAMAFLRHCNGSLTLPEQKLAILDLDGDGAVTTGDAQRYLCQLEDLEGAVMEDTGCTVAPGGSASAAPPIRG